MSHSDSTAPGNWTVGRREFLLAAAGTWAAGRVAEAAPLPAPAARVRWTVPDAGWVLGHSPDGGSLFTWKTEKGQPALVVWDLTTGKRVRAHRLPVGETEHGKQFPHDLVGGRYFVCEYQEKLLAFDLKTGDEWRHDLSAHADSRGFRMSPTGKVFDRRNGYGVTHLIETRSGKIVHQIGERGQKPGRAWVYGKADGTEFTPDGRYFVYHFRDVGGPFVEVWDVAGRKVLGRLGVFGTLSGIACPVVTAGGRLLLAPTRLPGAGPDQPDLHPFERAPGQYTVWSLPDLKERCVIPWRRAGAPTDVLTPLAFSPDGRRVAAWPGGDGLQFWDLEAGTRLGSVYVRPGASDDQPVFWSPDGTKVATFWRDEPVIRVFDPARERELWCCPSNAYLGRPYFARDSGLVAFSTGEKVVFLDASTGAERLTVPALNRAEALHPTPDGRYFWFADSRPDRTQPFASGGFEPIITWRVLHRDTGREALRIEAHKDWVGSARRSEFLGVGERTVVQMEQTDEPRSCDLTCWEVGPP